MKRILGMGMVLALLLTVLVFPALAQYRITKQCATQNEWLIGVLDTTSAYVQTFTATDMWPNTWGYESWGYCMTSVPDTIWHQRRDLYYPAGTWTSWYNVDTTLQADFTTGVSVHNFQRFPDTPVKPYSFQLRDVQKDAAAACSSYWYHRVYAW